MDLTGGYWPDARLARVPPGPKLLALAVIGIVVFAIDTRASIAALTALTAVIVAISGVPPRVGWRTLRALWWFLAAIIAFEAITGEILDGVRHAVRLADLVLLAMLVTATTSFHALFDVVLRLLRPLRPLGVKPDAVALAAGMTMRFIPLLVETAGQTRDAYRVRGVRARTPQLVFPVLRRALLLANEVGLALTAREPRGGDSARG